MNIKEINRLRKLTAYEDNLYGCGMEYIAGADEAGRGSLAGPLVAAAVILDKKCMLIDGLNDSKKIPPKKRQQLFKIITGSCVCWSVAAVGPRKIDDLNIGRANILALSRAVGKLNIKPDIILSDFFSFDAKAQVVPLTNGDMLSLSIAAASIVAKVIRDNIMVKFDRYYPEYGFSKNKGYATREHLLSLQKYGPSHIHRLSFTGVLN
ncbi:MAG: ribonuclease HII [Actinomycetia bacterium]|nr:ribonuclease HII [Actinomycetes bacterium]